MGLEFRRVLFRSYLISGALRGVISQRLVRRICPNCRKTYTASPGECMDLDLPAGEVHTLSRGDGCPSCYYTGYRGRIGAFEILILDVELRRLVSSGKLPDKSSQIGRSTFISMEESCRRLVLTGITTAEEAKRAMNSSE